MVATCCDFCAKNPGICLNWYCFFGILCLQLRRCWCKIDSDVYRSKRVLIHLIHDQVFFPAFPFVDQHRLSVATLPVGCGDLVSRHCWTALLDANGMNSIAGLQAFWWNPRQQHNRLKIDVWPLDVSICLDDLRTRETSHQLRICTRRVKDRKTNWVIPCGNDERNTIKTY